VGGGHHVRAAAEELCLSGRDPERVLAQSHLRGLIPQPRKAQRQIPRFFEQVYNPKRLDSSFGYVPHAECELQYKQTAPAA